MAMAEGYIVAAAVALENAGHRLNESPRRPWQVDADDETIGGWIGLPGAMDGVGLGLVWRETDGWQIGISHHVSGVDCLTPLRLGVAPPPADVVAAVARVIQAGKLTAAPADAEPDTSGIEDLRIHVGQSIKLLPKVAVFEPTPQVLSRPVYAIYYWRFGERDGQSLATARDAAGWVRDLWASCWDVRFGWELRGEPAPAGFPSREEIWGDRG